MTTARTDAEQLLDRDPALRFAVVTDMQTERKQIAIGLAIRGVGSLLIGVDRGDYDGRKLLAWLDSHAPAQAATK